MFHTYVLNARRIPVDFDRATFLMDKTIKDDVAAWLESYKDNLPSKDNSTLAQAFFDEYSGRHFDKYGEHFPPKVTQEPF